MKCADFTQLFIYALFAVSLTICSSDNTCCQSAEYSYYGLVDIDYSSLCPTNSYCVDCVCRCANGYAETGDPKLCTREEHRCETDEDCGNAGAGNCTDNYCVCNDGFDWSDEYNECYVSFVKKKLIIEYLEFIIIFVIVVILIWIGCAYRYYKRVTRRRRDVEVGNKF